MHMADALLSATMGLTMWAAAGTALVVASRRVQTHADERVVPLMGMLGAFVFAAQMINFSIPGTGSSGHLGGGLLLAALLGPHAALVVMASVLTVQALLFADGGLLALGANIFNLGVLPCLLVYPLLFRPLTGRQPTPRRLAAAALTSGVVALLLGAACLVLQTAASGISSLPLDLFALLMLPIHAAIGGAEGLATAAILLFVWRQRPELLHAAAAGHPTRRWRFFLATLGLAGLLLAGVGSWFASSRPDGLEWSLAGATGSPALAAPEAGLHAALARVQEAAAPMPGYAWPAAAPSGPAPDAAAAWPAVDAGTSMAGVLGGAATLALVLAIGLGLRLRRRAQRQRG